MSDQCEEQEMEAEALLAIFDDCAEIISSTQPFEWAVTLYPEQHGEGINHVGIKVIAKIPLDYPESLPTIDIEILKGLSDDHKQELAAMAAEEAQANLGLPSIFAVCERLREWLAENNQKGMDDVSMYAQMMRKQKEAAKQEQKAQQQFESAKLNDAMTETESSEMAVHKRRAEGTPCTRVNFLAWKAKFEAEMEERRDDQDAAENAGPVKKKREKVVDKTGRISGFLQFSDKTATLNLEDMEAAWENAQKDEDEESDEENLENVDEDLFVGGDDEDLDDLDFDDDDDDDEEPDI